jgi:LmbE family N-acetylglucosaminyl deacetylase
VTSNIFDELPASTPPLSVPRSAMTVGAHPDDAEFGAGATLARWASQGCEVTILVITDGSKGSWNPDENRAGLIERRIGEQQSAAAKLGASRTIHLGEIDGELEYSYALRVAVARYIRECTPQVVLSHDPWQRYQLHPDHRATGLAAVDGVVSAREPLAMTDSGLPAHRPDAILLWSADQPDHAEPVADEWEAVKIDALLCHSSQGETTMGDAQSSDERKAAFAERISEWHRSAGAVFGLGKSETFKRLTP